MRLAFAPLCAAFVLTGSACASHGVPPPGASAQAGPDWRTIITDDDRGRLRNWRTAWTRALTKAQASGHDQEIAAEGALLDPDAAQSWQDPLPGLYRCRTIKLGAQSEGMLDYVVYPAFDCRIRAEDGFVSFTKLSGSQRPIGLILSYSANRMLFLGTLQLGDETRALEYGRDRERDLVALVERIGAYRWRLVFPYPHFESTMDVIEVAPAPSQ